MPHWKPRIDFLLVYLVLMASSSCSARKPKLIVFDLDYTLWPFWVDTHVTPPFRKEKDGVVYDRYNQKVRYYKDVPAILEKLHKEGYMLGVASRTSCVSEAKQLLELFNWNKYFRYLEIYPGVKTHHFQKFKEHTGFSYSDMLFFDDEGRNIKDVSKIGVTCIHVPNGMSLRLLEEGLQKFQHATS